MEESAPLHGDDCQKAVTAVYRYLDGYMEATETVAITRHLHRCRGCADVVEFERLFLTRVRQACRCDEVPADLMEKLQALLRRNAGESA